ncbi:MAG: hypothetical protein ABIJ83_04950 [Patescibacteria group bacterium]|nr:hypothetical protein [Patescibacteria group bacterium]MBU2250096.1 hypothetical protein [Patescibacteria group bacterium]
MQEILKVQTVEEKKSEYIQTLKTKITSAKQQEYRVTEDSSGLIIVGPKEKETFFSSSVKPEKLIEELEKVYAQLLIEKAKSLYGYTVEENGDAITITRPNQKQFTLTVKCDPKEIIEILENKISDSEATQ